MSKSASRAKKNQANQASEYIFFVSGGCIKANRIYVGWCDEEPATFAKEKLASFFSDQVNGKAYPCEDAEAKCAKILEHKNRIGESNIIEISIKEAQDLMKSVIDDPKIKAHNFKLTTEIATKKPKKKKDNKDDENGSDNNDDEDDDKDNENDNKDNDNDDKDNHDSDNEAAAASAKASKKKSAAKKKQAKKDDKNDSNDDKNSGDDSDEKEKAKKKKEKKQKADTEETSKAKKASDTKKKR